MNWNIHRALITDATSTISEFSNGKHDKIGSGTGAHPFFSQTERNWAEENTNVCLAETGGNSCPLSLGSAERTI